MSSSEKNNALDENVT